MRPLPTRFSVLLIAALLQPPSHAQDLPQTPSSGASETLATPAWRERFIHDWDLLRGRPDPLHQTLAAVRDDLRTARDERFLAKRGAYSDMYIRQALSELHNVWRDVRGQWIDPMFTQRLELVTRSVQAMAADALVQTPELYGRLDWELRKLLKWRWAP